MIQYYANRAEGGAAAIVTEPLNSVRGFRSVAITVPHVLDVGDTEQMVEDFATSARRLERLRILWRGDFSGTRTLVPPVPVTFV